MVGTSEVFVINFISILVASLPSNFPFYIFKGIDTKTV